MRKHSISVMIIAIIKVTKGKAKNHDIMTSSDPTMLHATTKPAVKVIGQNPRNKSKVYRLLHMKSLLDLQLPIFRFNLLSP